MTAPAAAAPPLPRRRRRWSSAAGRDSAAGYALVTPSMLLLGLFILGPLVGAAVLSLQQTDGFGAGTFVGVENYQRLLADGAFWRAALNTLAFAAIVTPLAMAGGLGLALLLSSALPARGLLRSVLILPMAISGVATALMGVLMFDQNSGILSKLVRALGLPAISWQTDGAAAFASIVLMTLWWRIGFNMLIYLAGLQGLGPELGEAARLDGAGWWQRLRHVTVPLLGPTSFFLAVLNVIYSFQVFDIVFVMTGGGPGNATSVLVTYAYDNAFVTRDQGYAASIGIVLLLLLLVFTAVQWKLSRNREVTE